MEETSIPSATHERGFSLFEILITIVVVSIGLLGLAGLQFAGLRAANDAQEHTLASLLAQDIEGRIKANILGANLGYYDSINLSNGGGAPTAPTMDCLTTPCSTQDMSRFDATQWYQAINHGGSNTMLLANASIRIQRCNVTNALKITIQWNGAKGAGGPCVLTSPTGPYTLIASFNP